MAGAPLPGVLEWRELSSPFAFACSSELMAPEPIFSTQVDVRVTVPSDGAGLTHLLHGKKVTAGGRYGKGVNLKQGRVIVTQISSITVRFSFLATPQDNF